MSYTKERDTFITLASREGLDMPTITKLLRYATTLQRLAVAQCNGDFPYNGDRDRPTMTFKTCEERKRHDAKYTTCPKCEASGVSKGAMRLSTELGNAKSQYPTERVRVCPDCRTQELVTFLLRAQQPRVWPVFGGDPRGAVLRLSTPNYPYDESGKNGANGLYVPARER